MATSGQTPDLAASAPDAPQEPSALMRAVVQLGYGSPDLLHVAQIPRPAPGPDDVLLRVQAAGVDRGTWHMLAGTPYAVRLAVGVRRPRNPVPGIDVSGTVTAVGSGVTGFAVGDEVFGVARGSFAEYALAASDRLARRPASLDPIHAAALPVSAGTALKALDAGHVSAGQKVLVTGASGGVGSYAVQLAKALGAEVTAVAGPAKQDFVRSLGADHALDHTREDFAAGAHRYDLIIDIAGNPSISRLRRALTPKGTAVIVGGENAGRITGLARQLRALAVSPFVGQRFTVVVYRSRAEDLARLVEFVDANSVVPAVDRTFPLDQAADALNHLVAGTVRGKLVVDVGA